MRVLMLTWEYPPKKVGGLSTHAYHLSNWLIELGNEVEVMTCSFPGKIGVERPKEGLTVHWVDVYNFPSPDFLSWAMGMNHGLTEYVSNLAGRKYDIIHAHDWMVIPTAVSIKYLFGRPLIYSIHSTEYGRRNGIHSDFSRVIHECEGWGTYEASSIIVCSRYMRDHVRWLFNVPDDKISVIPNGVTLNPVKDVSVEFRRRYARDDEKIVLFVGRLVHEKGLNVLLGAMAILLGWGIKAKLLVVGDGYAADEMKRLAWDIGIFDKVYFTGYVSDSELNSIFKIADVLCVPSLFEPFGIVTLEGMASGVPVVVSDVGGLSEIIRDSENGLKVRPNNSWEIASALRMVLTDAEFRNHIVANALEDVLKRFSWKSVASSVQEVYNSSIKYSSAFR